MAVRNKKGQTVIEMALSLPLIIWLLYYIINAFYSLHTAHVGQKYAAMNLWSRINNRAKFVVDDVANNGAGQLHNREFMAVQATDENGKVPQRRIIQGPSNIDTAVGICREPGCSR